MKKNSKKILAFLFGLFLLFNLRFAIVDNEIQVTIQPLMAETLDPKDCWDDVTVGGNNNYKIFCELVVNGDTEKCKYAWLTHYDGLNTCTNNPQ